ncbi:hypothetical protein PMIT1323_02491 [Prochlorococcus marinus str. MIT 1323]|nr:hypothetical protein PMIT1323_02491 [Prochlorococcus marinus str. MIT 1323]
MGLSDTVNFRVESAFPPVTVSLLVLIDLVFCLYMFCNSLEDGFI